MARLNHDLLSMFLNRRVPQGWSKRLLLVTVAFLTQWRPSKWLQFHDNLLPTEDATSDTDGETAWGRTRSSGRIRNRSENVVDCTSFIFSHAVVLLPQEQRRGSSATSVVSSQRTKRRAPSRSKSIEIFSRRQGTPGSTTTVTSAIKNTNGNAKRATTIGSLLQQSRVENDKDVVDHEPGLPTPMDSEMKTSVKVKRHRQQGARPTSDRNHHQEQEDQHRGPADGSRGNKPRDIKVDIEQRGGRGKHRRMSIIKGSTTRGETKPGPQSQSSSDVGSETAPSKRRLLPAVAGTGDDLPEQDFAPQESPVEVQKVLRNSCCGDDATTTSDVTAGAAGFGGSGFPSYGPSIILGPGGGGCGCVLVVVIALAGLLFVALAVIFIMVCVCRKHFCCIEPPEEAWCRGCCPEGDEKRHTRKTASQRKTHHHHHHDHDQKNSRKTRASSRTTQLHGQLREEHERKSEKLVIPPIIVSPITPTVRTSTRNTYNVGGASPGDRDYRDYRDQTSHVGIATHLLHDHHHPNHEHRHRPPTPSPARSPTRASSVVVLTAHDHHHDPRQTTASSRATSSVIPLHGPFADRSTTGVVVPRGTTASDRSQASSVSRGTTGSTTNPRATDRSSRPYRLSSPGTTTVGAQGAASTPKSAGHRYHHDLHRGRGPSLRRGRAAAGEGDHGMNLGDVVAANISSSTLTGLTSLPSSYAHLTAQLPSSFAHLTTQLPSSFIAPPGGSEEVDDSHVTTVVSAVTSSTSKENVEVDAALEQVLAPHDRKPKDAKEVGSNKDEFSLGGSSSQ